MRIYSFKSKSPADKKNPGKRKKNWPKIRPPFNSKSLFTWLFRLSAFGIFFIALLFLYYTKDLPDPNRLSERNVAESTKILARDGSLLYEIHGEKKRTLVELEQISESAKQATVAIEDKDFYRHHGISFSGIMRSAVRYVINRGPSGGGGSTLTQQFVKNAVLSKDKSFDRKIREAILALAIEARFSKNEILKLYLNEIPYGRNAYGIEAAAKTYFNKGASELTLAESAYLAAIPQAPTYYNPLGPNRQSLDNRKNLVLSMMREQGYISAEQEKLAKEEKVEFEKIKTAISAPHFVMMVQDYLAGKFGEKTLEEGGLKVYTTLDPKLQKIAEQAVREGVEKFSKKYNANNAALVAIDPKTGHILAMVGSKDYFGEVSPEGCTPGKNCQFEPQVNVALSQRQPGSSFKPFAYVTAFKKEFKYSPASMLMDVTTNFGSFGGKDYIPNNYNGSSYGPVSMRKALAGSLNVPAVKTLALTGVESVIQTARDLGITSPLADCGLSLVLGGCEVRLLDHTAAFAAIANMGAKNQKTPILKIEDRQGRVIEEFQPNPQQVLDPQAAYQLINIMTDNEARSYIFGSRSPLTLPGRTVAAKTGTTQNWRDGWTMGFTPSLAVGVWAGNNDGTLMKRGADGVFVAAPIWNEFLKEALKDSPTEDFQSPPGIKKIAVDAVSGKLPTDFTPATKVEVFADYSVPTDYDDVHIQAAIDSATGLPADSLTPPDRITYQVYTVFHSEKKENPNWENPVIAWAQANGYAYPQNSNIQTTIQNGGNGLVSVSILEPADNSTISSLPFRVTASASSPNPIARMDLYVDGQFITSTQSSPHTFDLNKSYSDGPRIIAIKAVDISGASADTSIRVNYLLSTPLNMAEPAPQSQLELPQTLIAESNNFYSQVNFYYQGESGPAKLIGSANNTTKLGDKFQYTFDWVIGDLEKGAYRIYAQTGSGITSPKVKVTVP